MSIPPPTITVPTIAVTAFTPDTGPHLQDNNSSYALAPYPVQNPPTLVGVDCIYGTLNGAATISFPNLPIRGTGNPLSKIGNQPKTLTIHPGDLLMFEISVQGAPGPVAVNGRIIDVNNIPHNAPFIGPGTYKDFQVTAVTTAPTNLVIWGKLYIQRGSGS